MTAWVVSGHIFESATFDLLHMLLFSSLCSVPYVMQCGASDFGCDKITLYWNLTELYHLLLSYSVPGASADPCRLFTYTVVYLLIDLRASYKPAHSWSCALPRRRYYYREHGSTFDTTTYRIFLGPKLQDN